ncbi:MAG: HAD hydrolase-like protein [Flavipsychrobacter sp.]|nr:HAD hydrolase-like protein [Flavipsychrobacter sp.]
MITNIFFDFDGVLCESVQVKTEAFRQLYLPYGKEISDAVVAYHQAHGGVSRYDKIRYYHKTLLHTKITDADLQKWSHRFSELVMAGVIAAPEVPGTTSFLEEHEHQYTYWVITATPTNEIKAILQEKGWDTYFAGVFGSPEKKGHWVRYILDNQKLDPAHTVFIGDALADKKAADDNSVSFILRNTPDNKVLFSGYNGKSINDLSQLKSVLNSL